MMDDAAADRAWRVMMVQRPRVAVVDGRIQLRPEQWSLLTALMVRFGLEEQPKFGARYLRARTGEDGPSC